MTIQGGLYIEVGFKPSAHYVIMGNLFWEEIPVLAKLVSVWYADADSTIH